MELRAVETYKSLRFAIFWEIFDNFLTKKTSKLEKKNLNRYGCFKN